MDDELKSSVSEFSYKSKSLDELLAILNFSDKQAFIEFYKYDEIDVVHRLSPTAIGCLSAIFCLIFIVGLTGNLFLIVLVICKRNMQTVINIFNVSLAFADLLITLFCIPFTLVEQVTEDWVLGRFMCKILNYITTVSVICSVLTMTAIAVERHSAICHPLRSKVIQTPRRAIICSIVIWCFTLMLNMPLFVLIDIAFFKHPFQDITYEFCEWKNGEQEKRVSLCYVILLYFVPLLFVCFLYIRIVRKLWIRNAVAPANIIQSRVDIMRNSNIYKKKRATKMLMLVVLLYAMCWLPYHVFILMRDFKSSGLEDTEKNRFLMALFQLLGLTNSCNNPVIYGFMNDKFKTNIAALVKGKPKLKPSSTGKKTPFQKATPVGFVVTSL
ncbi:QRFP-like peptide receptor [Holothuria leucospilota]|uniref:QRFP-like peptide receptor n=1 Tax=Holothuria leucospilota TaxID=206669 RepID=A0A9Q0YH63_HOLLE|nr:QRFP-like peptide receptor [Holothuria leucospilota]